MTAEQAFWVITILVSVGASMGIAWALMIGLGGKNG